MAGSKAAMNQLNYLSELMLHMQNLPRDVLKSFETGEDGVDCRCAGAIVGSIVPGLGTALGGMIGGTLQFP